MAILSFTKDFRGNKSNEKFWLVLLYLIFVLVAGLRYDRGADTSGYVPYFRSVPLIFNLSAHSFADVRYQPGFVVFYSLCKTLVNNFSFALIIEALFVNYSIFKFIKRYSHYPFVAILCYFIINYLEFNMDIQRESMAIAFGLLSWMSLDDKKTAKSILYFVLAFSFHISATMLLLYPLLTHVKTTTKSVVLMFAVAILIPIILFSIPNLNFIVSSILNSDEASHIDLYTRQAFNEDINFNAYLIHILHFLFLCFVLFYLKIKENTDKYAGFVLTLSVLFFFSTVSYGFYRFANYMCPFYWIVLSDFIVPFSKKIAKPLGLMAFCIFFLYLTYYHQRKLLAYNLDWSQYEYNYENYLPYQSILFDGSYK